MFNVRLFYEIDGVVHLNKYILTIRYYKGVDKIGSTNPEDYDDEVLYTNEEGRKEFEEQHIAKHQLLALASKEVIDTSPYDWMEGLPLRTTEPFKEIEEIYNYGSYEAYVASLPESTDDFKIDTDYRLSKLELGI